MGNLLTRKRQLAVKVESTEGTFESDLATESTAKSHAVVLLSPSFSQNPLRFDRQIVHPSLSNIDMFTPGVSLVELTFSQEIAGHTDNASPSADYTAPPVDPLMTACGFRGELVQGISIDGGLSWTGNTGNVMEHGEGVTSNDTTPATGEVVGDTINGRDSKIYIRNVANTFGGGSFTITGDNSSTVVGQNVVDTYKVWSWALRSTVSETNSVSMVYYIDGKQVHIKGARGNVEIVMEHGQPLRANFTMTGILHAVVDDSLLEGANRPAIRQVVPPACLGTGFALNDGGLNDPTNGNTVSPTYNTITINLNNEVTARENSRLAASWLSAVITNRAPTLTVNLDQELVADFPFEQNFEDGNLHTGLMSVGTATGNTFAMRFAGQIDAMAEGERDSVSLYDTTLGLKAGVYGTSPTGSGAFGQENEFTIINT